MTVSRIDLADFGSPDNIAREILRLSPEIEIPIPIEKIALQLDVSGIEELTTDGFEGGLFTDENKSASIILVNKLSPRQRQRFTIGHELFHFLCPTHKPLTPDGFLCTEADMRLNHAADRAKQMEIEANSFSAQILLPRKYFSADLRKKRGADIEHIQLLALRYDTSKEATARRYVELHEEPCAAIISQNGEILRYYRNGDFPFLEPRPRDRLPDLSRSAQISIEIGSTSEWMEVDSAAWLPCGRGDRLPLMYEQVQRQRNGYALTLLTIE